MNILQATVTKSKVSLSKIKELDAALTEAINNNDANQVNNICKEINHYYKHPTLVDEDAYNYIENDMYWF